MKLKQNRTGQVAMEYILLLAIVVIAATILKSLLSPAINTAVKNIDNLMRSRLAGDNLYKLPWH